MGLFKKNPFGHILFLKKWLIRLFGLMTHRRYRGLNELSIATIELNDIPAAAIKGDKKPKNAKGIITIL